MEKTNTKTPESNVPKQGDGLILKGLVVSIDEQDRKFNNEQYRQLVASITDGRTSYLYIADNRNGRQLPELKPFSRVKVDVDYTKTESRIIQVRGEITNDVN